MKKKDHKIQLALIVVGLTLFSLTYLYYPNTEKNKLFEKEVIEKNLVEKSVDNQITAFENVQYKGLYDFDKPFTVESEKAYISNEKPDIVIMANMNVTLYLNDGRVVIITADKGSYNKATYDCFFRQNVKATDESTTIYAENLDLVATENSVEVYNDVSLDYTTGYLEADKINYNFETKLFKVSMFNDESIKMKITQ